MKINVGDRVSYPDVVVLGQTLIPAGVGMVMDVKADPYGKTSRQIAVVKGARKEPFEAFTSALQVVVEGGDQR
ncbi:hypothetical protein [Lactobacillus sp. CBA3605] [Lactiplantibacillus mudanjiangensis]|uniref:hypothetical protein n=1 Tax=Lactiplantibacillus mudanjiangensis TaxID=1296538 RepID=UPI001015394B|nr:hypothetical protein [Lactobacillus sp. CBA3605] [Lactiplantibacillus mudanjiangensis]